MTRETQSKLSKLLLEWIVKPIIPAALVAVFVFASQTNSGLQVSASEVNNIKANQAVISTQIRDLNNGLESKTDELTNVRNISELKKELNDKALKSDVDDLSRSVQRIDDRTYQILILLQKK